MKTALSKRQVQVLKMLLAGYRQHEICKLLNLHTNTVANYKKLIMEKWEVETTVELVIESIKRGYLEVEPEEEVKPIKFVYSNHSLSHDTFVYYGATRRMYTYTHLIRE